MVLYFTGTGNSRHIAERIAHALGDELVSLNDRIKANYGRDTSLIYYDEVLKDIGRVTDIDFGKRIRTLGEIKKVLAKTKK